MPAVRLHVTVLALLFASVAGGAEPAPSLAVRRAQGEIRLDGDLSDPGWQGAAVLDPFWETQPGDNVPPRVKTTAWVAYDDRPPLHRPCGARTRTRRGSAPPSWSATTSWAPTTTWPSSSTPAATASPPCELRVEPERPAGRRGLQRRLAERGLRARLLLRHRGPDHRLAAGRPRCGIPLLVAPLPQAGRRRSGGSSSGATTHATTATSSTAGPIPRGSDCLVCHAQPMVGLTGLPTSGGLVLAPYASGQDVADGRFAGGAARRTGANGTSGST